jgi:hypothetical protein
MFYPLGRYQLVGGTGDGELGSQRHPDAADDDSQMPLATVPPARIPRPTPGGFGINRGVRDNTCQPMFLLPDAAIGAQGRTVNSRRVSLSCPRLQQRDQIASETAEQGEQSGGQCLKAPFPSAPRRKTPVLRQQKT